MKKFLVKNGPALVASVVGVFLFIGLAYLADKVNTAKENDGPGMDIFFPGYTNYEKISDPKIIPGRHKFLRVSYYDVDTDTGRREIKSSEERYLILDKSKKTILEVGKDKFYTLMVKTR